MNSRINLRNGIFSVLIIFVVFLIAAQQVPAAAAPLAQVLVSVTPPNATAELAPNTSTTVIFTVANNTDENRTFNAAFSGIPSGFTVIQQSTVAIPANSSSEVSIIVTSTAANQAPGNYGAVTVTFTGVPPSGANVTGSATINVVVTGATFTPTPSATGTPIPATVTPTTGPVCRDGFEDDNNPASAKRIDVNTAQLRTICPTGDEDWLYFGGVGGKVYTIDVSRQDPGLDLTLTLYDPHLNQIAFNHDFFLRDPANPNPGDTRPRITIRIPYDATYYIRVRDAAGRGGVDYFYEIALLDESYGPTPAQVDFVCLDIFEPDGLPEQARLITSNEIQENRSLCPAGDADWVTFFGKAGKRYVIYTDTRRYRGRIVVNGETQAGADTVMVLTDRDGATILDFNDDIPGGNTLDSQIEFIPDVDGFYFVQIKNVGDIGNQFIRYDLVLLLCLPGQTDCGRTSITDAPVNPITPQPTGTPAEEFLLDPTNTPVVQTPTPTPEEE